MATKKAKTQDVQYINLEAAKSDFNSIASVIEENLVVANTKTTEILRVLNFVDNCDDVPDVKKWIIDNCKSYPTSERTIKQNWAKFETVKRKSQLTSGKNNFVTKYFSDNFGGLTLEKIGMLARIDKLVTDARMMGQLVNVACDKSPDELKDYFEKYKKNGKPYPLVIKGKKPNEPKPVDKDKINGILGQYDNSSDVTVQKMIAEVRAALGIELTVEKAA